MQKASSFIFRSSSIAVRQTRAVIAVHAPCKHCNKLEGRWRHHSVAHRSLRVRCAFAHTHAAQPNLVGSVINLTRYVMARFTAVRPISASILDHLQSNLSSEAEPKASRADNHNPLFSLLSKAVQGACTHRFTTHLFVCLPATCGRLGAPLQCASVPCIGLRTTLQIFRAQHRAASQSSNSSC